MSPPHIDVVRHQVFAHGVPYYIRHAERYANERHGLPGISQHKI
jgi:hypothetical protein